MLSGNTTLSELDKLKPAVTKSAKMGQEITGLPIIPIRNFKFEIDYARGGNKTMKKATYVGEPTNEIKKDEKVAVLYTSFYDVSELDYYRNELSILKSIDHPSIVKIRAIVDWPLFDDEERATFIEELVEGDTLYNILQTTRLDDKAKRYSCVIQLFDVLKYLHSKHIVHGDISTPNILINENEKEPRIKLIDFGYSFDTSKHSEYPFEPYLGRYHSPYYSDHHSIESDLFACGIVVAELFQCDSFERCYGGYKVLPSLEFSIDDLQSKVADEKSIADIKKHIPEELRNTIESLQKELAKNIKEQTSADSTRDKMVVILKKYVQDGFISKFTDKTEDKIIKNLLAACMKEKSTWDEVSVVLKEVQTEYEKLLKNSLKEEEKTTDNNTNKLSNNSGLNPNSFFAVSPAKQNQTSNVISNKTYEEEVISLMEKNQFIIGSA